MEDVVLHYQPGSSAGLSSLLERTEKLLESFPRRIPPVFTPWSPTAADHHLPIRPAKPAPVITCSGDLHFSDSRTHPHTAQIQLQKSEVDGLVAKRLQDRPPAETPPQNTQEPKDAACISEAPNHLFPEREVTVLPLEKHKDGLAVTDSPVKRSWSIFTQKGGLLQSSPSLSKQFHHMVSVHRLHLHQRAKWVISQHNCGADRDMEQVWRTLSLSVRSSRLPTCNANIQRERAEIWVFCDVLHSEQVGRLLKAELQLSGRIGLSVHRLENIFTM
ncbi:shieldin complex subunit 3 [Cottoperca gobio]|uniref:Shieldin complex subunit 3-like n=1 Tax=Cottoperca gobio TaxID=56716 RepID=A0A6J2Q8H8_COTGO|nr:shieldin complex subunit 3-like [Cottoperca gobio]XP_029294742.1 shieldin complex subunit 3-like [Cottoperca gobio]XP_029294743.1 shieldin complex subunit 3-like [Cottoperca gobio]